MKQSTCFLIITGCIFTLILITCGTRSVKVDVNGLPNWNCGCIYKNKDNVLDTAITESGSTDLPFSGGNATDLFNYHHVPMFDVYLPPGAWENLKINARDEEYTEAFACFEGSDIGRVGIRFKGSYGSLYNCFDENGKNICRKLSMKIKFDEYDPNNRFFGLRRLNFHGNRYDDTYLRERLAYDLFHEMGIAAPRTAWAMLRVNNEFQGLFGMVEQVDECFISDRWPDNPDGNLYKEAWPVSTDYDWVTSRLKTNRKVGNVDTFIAFSRAVNSAANDELRITLGRFVDLDYMAHYMAVDDAIASYDGITAYYTSADAQWAGNHNFYFYEEAAERFTIIPWDLESTFTENSGFGNVPRWTDLPEDCSVKYNVWGSTSLVIAPGCDRVFRALAADLGKYREACRVLLDGPFTKAAMSAAIDKHAAFIREAVKADPRGPGVNAFEKGITFLKKEIPRLRKRLERLIAGNTFKPLDIDSPKHSAADQGICFGWDIQLTQKPVEVEVRFTDASIVSWVVNQGRDPGDNLGDVLAAINGIEFSPQCNGRKINGQLPGESTDKGFIRVDDIEVF